MTNTDEQWRGVDEGWGRRAADFATMVETGSCREYVALQQELDVRAGDRLLDVACGSGLAVELAAARGATCAGLDASPRLVAVARERSPGADLRVGDMHALPWSDGSFDVVTSFRGIWGTTPDALAEVLRVLAPGGRLGLTVWGHIKASTGAWALRPFTLATEDRVANQAAMVALGRPGVGEELLSSWGFEGVRRVAVPFAWEFADPDSYARAIAATGPAYEAIQAVGEEAFTRYARDLALERVRDGLPLRAEIEVVGYVARKPAAAQEGHGFLAAAADGPATELLYAEDLDDLGYVMNGTRLWGHVPEAMNGLFALLDTVAEAGRLSFRHRAILVLSTASTLGDSYCSLAWGGKLATRAGPDVAAAVLRGDDTALDPAERALAVWARRVVRDPNSTSAADLQALRDAGFDDRQIFALTVYAAGRLAFSTVNDALGARPDLALADAVPDVVRDAVTFGRPVDPSSVAPR